MATRAILLVALTAFLFTGMVRAGDEPKLPGSTIKIEDAVAKADTIYIGKIVSYGFVGLRAKGKREYFHNEVDISETLRGPVLIQDAFSFWVVDVVHERPPREGPSYIFFLSSELSNQSTAIKLLPATDGNLAKVKTMLHNKQLSRHDFYFNPATNEWTSLKLLP